jgi:hypothetical protein
MEDNQNPTNNPGVSNSLNNQTSEAPSAAPKRQTVLFIILGIVVVLALVVWLVVASKKAAVPASNSVADKTQTQVPKTPTIVPVAADVVPQGLPANLPWENGALITQNFTGKDPVTGKTQSTRIYNSAKTLDANFAQYQKYLQDNGWTINSSINQPDVKNLNSVKGDTRLVITMAKDPTGQVVVSVSYVD